MKYQIITINREFASCGSEIAQQVAQRLHITYVDKFLITEAAQQGGFRADRVEATDEQLASRFEYSQAEAAHYYATASSALPTTAQIAEIQFKLIEEMSQRGPCVIVGRCANHVLRSRDDVLDVFIHASRDVRIRETMKMFSLKENEAVRLLKRTDKARKAYYKNYTGMDWNDPNSYHMVLNSDLLPMELCVKLICDAYQGT